MVSSDWGLQRGIHLSRCPLVPLKGPVVSDSIAHQSNSLLVVLTQEGPGTLKENKRNQLQHGFYPAKDTQVKSNRAVDRNQVRVIYCVIRSTNFKLESLILLKVQYPLISDV